MTASKAVPLAVMLLGLILTVMPGVDVAVRLTVALNPFNGVMVIVELAELPDWKVRWVGLAVIVKLGGAAAVTRTPTWTERERVLEVLLPVIPTM